MATITTGSPLRTLARILHAAAVLGPDAWGGGAGDDGGVSGTEAGLSDDLRVLFTTLNQGQIPYCLVGGVALLKYIHGRNTDDVDLVMSVSSLTKVPELDVGDRSGDFARGKFRSVRVDLLLTRNRLFKLVHDRYASTLTFLEIEVRCATVEGLILLKLYALPSLHRQGDAQRVALYEGDITMLCLGHQPDLGPLLTVLRDHVTAGEHEELVKVVAEIGQRVKRLTGRTGA